MKKILLLCSMIVCCCSTYAQQISFTSAPVVYSNDASVLIKATGENRDLAIDMEIVPFIKSVTIESPNNQNYASNITYSNQTTVSKYNPSSNGASSMKATINNSASVPIKLTITYSVTFINVNGASFSTGEVKYTVTVNPGSAPPSTITNKERVVTLYNNTCSTGFGSEPYTYKVPANKYSGSTQNEVDNKVANDINTIGQNLANANTTCKPLVGNVMVSKAFAPACSVGSEYAGPMITYTVPANTYLAITQDAANALAQKDINDNGQNNANKSCSKSPVYVKNPNGLIPLPGGGGINVSPERSGMFSHIFIPGAPTGSLRITNSTISKVFQKNDCPSGNIGGQVIYTIPQGKYFVDYVGTVTPGRGRFYPDPTYYPARDKLDALINADINSNGQNYANSHGICTTTNQIKYARLVTNAVSNYPDGELKDVSITVQIFSDREGTRPLYVTNLQISYVVSNDFFTTYTNRNAMIAGGDHLTIDTKTYLDGPHRSNGSDQPKGSSSPTDSGYVLNPSNDYVIIN